MMRRSAADTFDRRRDALAECLETPPSTAIPEQISVRNGLMFSVEMRANFIGPAELQHPIPKSHSNYSAKPELWNGRPEL
jgi:hypothetical protein